ncbi:MAG: glycosyltransferase family 1 protein [Gemmatimonadaceae bacterium]
MTVRTPPSAPAYSAAMPVRRAPHAPERGDASDLRVALCTDTYTPQVNGVALTLERLVRAIEARGGAVHVETVDVPGAPRSEQLQRAASIPFWAYPQLRIAAPPRGVARRLAHFAPTLVHAATPFVVGIAGRRVAAQRAVPMVSSFHTSFVSYLPHYGLGALDRVAWPFLRWFHNSGCRTFAPSGIIAEQLRQQRFERVRVWGRGVDLQQFAPHHRSVALRSSLGLAPEDCLITYVGRLAPEKDLPTLLRAVHRLQASMPTRVHLAIAGDGPAEAALRAMAPEGTRFMGALRGAALSAFFASGDIFAFPSATETFGNVVLEAMASGVAVVAPNVGATTELAHPLTARTFAPGDDAALATELQALIASPAERARLQRAGLVEAALRSWDAVWDGLIADYREACGSAVGR